MLIERILNKKLFYYSIASLVIILIFSLSFKRALFGLIPLPFTILSSLNRKYVKIAIVTSFLSSILEFLSPAYPVLLLLSFITYFNVYLGVSIVGITDVSMILIYLVYKLTNTPLNGLILFPVSLTLAFLGFLSIRAYKGFDYDVIIFKANGIQNNDTWHIKFNGKVFPVKGNVAEIISDSGSYIICPKKEGSYYLIPDKYFGEARGGEIINVNFYRSSTIELKKYNDCVVYFIGRNVPVDFSIKVDGIKFKGKEIVILPQRPTVDWFVEDVVVDNILFEPKVKSGKALIGQTVEINFEPKLLKKVQKLDVLNWNPDVWINQIVYGYKIVDRLGEGGASYVLKAEKEGKFYAIKIPKVEPSRSQTRALKDFADLFKESNNLIELSNYDGLVKLYGIFVDVNQLKSIIKGDGETYLKYPPAIIMEFMEGGTLKDLMNLYSQTPQWYELVKLILERISLALAHVHKSGYVHLDVKPQNVFFSERLPHDISSILSLLTSKPDSIKLGDLGSASKIGGKITQITPEYSSPLQLENAIFGQGATPQMDIFSVGMVLYYLLTGKVSPIAKLMDEAIDLYNNNDIRGSLLRIDQAKKILETWNIDVPPNVPSDLRKIIEDCIKEKIKNAEEIYNRLNLIII